MALSPRKRVVILLAHSLIVLVGNVAGKLYVTAPIDGTTWTAGQNQTISWKEDGSSPSLAQFGKASVGIYVGSATVQTVVQQIVASVDVATTESIVFTTDPSVGASGDYYFIRFQSLNLKDPNNTAYPAEAFSATFTINGMTGSFNASEKSELGSLFDASATASAGAQSGGALSPTTTPSKSATSSRAFNDAMPTATDSANGSTHRISSIIPGWVVVAFVTFIFTFWVR